MLETRDSNVSRLQIVSSIPRPRQDHSRPHVGAWQPMIGGGLMRIVHVPLGADEETTQCLLATE